ncbi:hypothetical protein F4780DRAFT_23160 [Xylariomycetidae sp. FL0641]|nr:hypothetical protein F4780DRAFT_23160 [Xylariomycetidae sp. FL0641]
MPLFLAPIQLSPLSRCLLATATDVGSLALQAVRNVVLLFSNPTWSNGHTVPSTIIRNITALSSDIAYSEDLLTNITTLSTNYVWTTNGVVQGLLYVPDLNVDDPCYDIAKDYIPANATRQVNLPTTDYNLIALAPWINEGCTKSFLASAGLDQLRGFLFYRPEDGAVKPPPAESDAWNLDEGDSWKTENHYPIYAIPGAAGWGMMQQLSLYSGDLASAPYASAINATYHPNPADYVRVWTELTVSTGPGSMQLWAFILIIIAVLLSVIGGTSMLMHCVQNRRRAALRRRVMCGDVNLEALGIKRLTVPLDHVRTFPLFTYNYHPSPASPTSPTSQTFEATSTISSKDTRKHSLSYQPTCMVCLEDFQSKSTVIRELPCGHIFHPECIDEFLSELSSLCPLCKASMLPIGHSPKITNSMVRREFGTRKLRASSTSYPDVETGRPKLSWISSGKKRNSRKADSTKPNTSIQLQEHSVIQRPPNALTTRERMEELVEPIEEFDSDDGRSPWKRVAVKAFPGFR